MRVLVTEVLGESGMAFLQEHTSVDVRTKLSHEELCAILPDYDALIVRSATKVNASLLESGKRLRVVARAGTGVDNIDVDAATRLGILVVNAPAGNSNAVAEHTIALILALARQLVPAADSLKAGRWEKNRLQGIEVRNKTLGLVGLGRIGRMVAAKAKGLEMRVVAFDPFVSPGGAASIGVELLTMDEVLQTADFISVHTPLTPATRGLIGERELAMIKPEAYLINAARGGLIDEKALREALDAGRLAGAALDVFEVEPVQDQALLAHENLVATPHLGGSTAEAQENIALEVARAVVDYLEGRFPPNPVNVPYVAPQEAEAMQPYIDLADRLGSFFIQWRTRISGPLELVFEGEVCEYDTRVLTAAFLAGLLRDATAEPVNIVNARHVASQAGLEVSEMALQRPDRTEGQITARMVNGPEPRDISGVLVNGKPHLAGLDGQRLDCVAQGHMIVDVHHDVPGIVGNLGQLLGSNGVNISFAQMGRARRGGEAIMILGIDDTPPADIIPQILELPHIRRAQVVELASLPGYDEL
ncbi:MAG: phosphoglycerate dehydrogenase [Anaerolineae bacterium]|jgi:D-3-phosphoglycerate dehydrogenase|nr:phosphoglycerate dehydrogenase [Chloroflexota bacterium]